MENEKFHRQDAFSSKKSVSDMGSSSGGTSGAEKLLDAIGELPEDMIGEASEMNVLREKWKRRKQVRRFLQISGGVAAAALLAIAIWGVGREKGYFGSGMSGTGSETGEKGTYEQSEASEPPMEIWNLSVEDAPETAEENSTSSKKVPSEESAPKKQEDTSDSLASQQQPSRSAEGETVQGQRLRAGQMYPVQVSTTGEGKERYVHFTLQFGQEGDAIRYGLKASANLSMELTASPADENNNRKLKGNTKSQIQCASGTQIGCAVRLSDAAIEAEDIAIPEWTEKDIHAVAGISITVRESADSSGEGRIVLGESDGNYYIAYLAE